MSIKPTTDYESSGIDAATLEWAAIPTSWTERGGTIAQAETRERIYYATRVAHDEVAEALVVKYVRPPSVAGDDVAFVRLFRAHEYEGGVVPQLVVDSACGPRAFPAVMRADKGESSPGIRRDELDAAILEDRYETGAILHRRG